MAGKISDLTNMSGSASIDRSADFLEISDSSGPTSYKVTPNFILGITGDPTGTSDTQTLTNKTLTSPTINTPTLTVNDNALTIRDNSDTTKIAQFQLSGITTGTTRTFTLPDADTTLVGTGTTQTLTSKTLTSPTITNPTITVDTISEFTSANGVTIDGLNIKDGAITTANSTPVGSVVQIVNTLSSAVATGTTTIPLDDTIPQNTEGNEYMTLAITPRSSSNILVIEAVLLLSHSAAAAFIIGALFQDSTANALAVATHLQTTATGGIMLQVRHALTAGTTSSTTFKIRAGSSAAGTTTFNGQSAGRLFGGITKSSIVITEYKA